MPSPVKVSPSPLRRCSTSALNDRSAMSQISCLRMLVSIFCKRADKGAAFVFGDAAEHAGLRVGHMRPERFKRRAPGIGDEDAHGAAVAGIGFAPDQAFGLQLIQRAADRVDCSMTA